MPETSAAGDVMLLLFRRVRHTAGAERNLIQVEESRLQVRTHQAVVGGLEQLRSCLKIILQASAT